MAQPLDDLAVPRSFTARYGDGVTHGLCLGGGGIFFIAWQTAYLHTLASKGTLFNVADKIVGTSAGSVVASALTGGRLGRVHKEMLVLAKASTMFPNFAPGSNLHPSQQRALDLFWEAGDSDAPTVRAIGHAALSARAPSPRAVRRNIALILGIRKWPTSALHITCVDAYSGERCVVTRDADVRISNAVAASCAVPGAATPQPIGDRYCIDGGVSGTGTHLDLLAGARRALVLALSDGSELTVGMATNTPGSAQQELADLASSGTEVMLRVPEEYDLEELMSPGAVPKALAMGVRQATADAADVHAFWQ